MGWFLPALVGAATGLIGSQAQNAANASMNAEARRWQERMSNSEFQRRVEDLKKAGLNPALAYQQGGASSPSTAPTQQEAPVKAGMASALSVQQAKANIDLTKASADKARAEATSAAQTARFDTNDQVWYRRLAGNQLDWMIKQDDQIIRQYTAEMTEEQKKVFETRMEWEIKNLQATHQLTRDQARAAYAQALLTGRTNTTGALVGDIAGGLRWATQNAAHGLRLLNPFRRRD